MKKSLIYGSLFGLIFGAIEYITVANDLSGLYFLTGALSLAAYIFVLIIILRQPDGKSYTTRFLRGVVFSLLIGVVYGLLAGAAGFIYAEKVANSTRDGVELIKEMGINNELVSEIEGEIKPTPEQNLIDEIVTALVFNALFGAMFSSIFATFIKPSQKVENEV